MKTAAHIVLTVLGLVVAYATAIVFLPLEEWWVRMLDFPRLQVALLGAAVVAFWLPFWKTARWWNVVVWVLALAATLYQCARIYPYTPLASKQMADAGPAPRTTISILVANVLMNNRDAGPLLAQIEQNDPDLVLLLEPDDWWMEAVRSIEPARPYIVRRPLDNTYGLMLYSRHPLHDPIVRELTEPGVPSVRAGIELEGGVAVTFHGAHPPPPVPTHADDSLPRDAELVLIARDIAKTSGPAIVAGDFNDVSWSDTTARFQKLSGLLDPRIGRGMFNSFHAKYFFARWPLDHLFASEEFLLVRMQRLPAIGSDHFPLLVELEYAPRDTELNDPPSPPDAEEVEEGADTVEEHREENSGGD